VLSQSNTLYVNGRTACSSRQSFNKTSVILCSRLPPLIKRVNLLALKNLLALSKILGLDLKKNTNKSSDFPSHLEIANRFHHHHRSCIILGSMHDHPVDREPIIEGDAARVGSYGSRARRDRVDKRECLALVRLPVTPFTRRKTGRTSHR